MFWLNMALIYGINEDFDAFNSWFFECSFI